MYTPHHAILHQWLKKYHWNTYTLHSCLTPSTLKIPAYIQRSTDAASLKRKGISEHSRKPRVAAADCLSIKSWCEEAVSITYLFLLLLSLWLQCEAHVQHPHVRRGSLAWLCQGQGNFCTPDKINMISIIECTALLLHYIRKSGSERNEIY